MKQWQAKEFANLAQVSVRTLHHYDKIGLLKPSLRQSNNYRLYSEGDLLKLQQIVALKFFGFELSQIQHLLTRNDSLTDSLAMQSRFLREKADSLLEASAILADISQACSNKESISWKKIIELIEVYKMTQQLQDAWVKEIFTPDELKDYVKFETELTTNATPGQKEQFERRWFDLVAEFKKQLHTDPNSEKGIDLGKQLMDWVNDVYGKEYAHLRTKKFEQGFAQGKGLDQHGLTPEVVAWMDKAMDAYLKQRAYSILDKVGKVADAELLPIWNQLLDEICGDQEDKKPTIIAIALQDEKVSPAAKAWLSAIYKIEK